MSPLFIASLVLFPSILLLFSLSNLTAPVKTELVVVTCRRPLITVSIARFLRLISLVSLLLSLEPVPVSNRTGKARLTEQRGKETSD